MFNASLIDALPCCHSGYRSEFPSQKLPYTRRWTSGFCRMMWPVGWESVLSVSDWETGRARPGTRLIPRVMNFLGYCPYETPKTFGVWLRMAREATGLPQAALARALRIDKGIFLNGNAGRRGPGSDRSCACESSSANLIWYQNGSPELYPIVRNPALRSAGHSRRTAGGNAIGPSARTAPRCRGCPRGVSPFDERDRTACTGGSFGFRQGRYSTFSARETCSTVHAPASTMRGNLLSHSGISCA